MQDNTTRHPKIHSLWMKFFLIVLLIGIFFRCFNIDRKAYWIDEAFTSLWVSGYTEVDMRSQFAKEGILSNRDLQKYKQVNAEKNVGDTIKSLMLEDPQHPPIYYVLLHSWMQLFGNSITAIRSLSVLFSLLVFPSVYWLCLELFNSSIVAWVAMAVMAVSPFHLIYAQEARPYSLWMAIALLSSAVLLRAIRVKTKIAWLTYAATIIFGLYTALFSGLVILSHGIYVVAIERFKLSHTLKSYIATATLAIIAFIPWIYVLFNNRQRIQDTTTWSSRTTPFFSLLVRWTGNLSRLFLDLGFDSSESLSKTAFLIPFILLLLLLVGYAIYFLWTTAPRRVSLFIIALIAGTAVVLIVPDLILGGRRSGAARYWISSYLGIQIAVAYLLANRISNIFKNEWQTKFWKLATITVISLGILSCVVSSQAENWWSKGTAEYPAIPDMARLVNQSKQPLFWIENKLAILRAFSYQFHDNVKIQLILSSELPSIPAEFENVFLYRPSEDLRQNIEQKYILKPIQELGRFATEMWRLENKVR